MAVKEVKVGLIGFGTVGAGVAACLLENGEVVARRTGIRPVLARIADVDVTTDRGVAVPKDILTTDGMGLIDQVDVVVELVGGTTVAKDFILTALARGKPVVTANKALLANHGEEIFAAAEKSKADIYYEASVAGGIPIIKILREGLVGNRIESIYGILNGTCNYILTRMERENADFAAVLKDAQALGYAEADPTFDVGGHDTAHKAVILASLAYGEWFGAASFHVEGIDGIELCDLRYAAELGYRIKLLAMIKQLTDGDVQLRVHPTLVPKASPLASIDHVFNGVLVRGTPIGDTFYVGRGAGRDATASAVVADIVDVGLNIKFGSHRRVPAFRIGKQFRHLLGMELIACRYYFRLRVTERPGVIAAIAAVLGAHQISISSIIQREGQQGQSIELLILSHLATEGKVQAAMAEIAGLDCIQGRPVMFRVEDV
jgi:homoserine dehydrogenase